MPVLFVVLGQDKDSIMWVLQKKQTLLSRMLLLHLLGTNEEAPKSCLSISNSLCEYCLLFISK